MCKILAHFPAWYHGNGKVYHGMFFPIWRFTAYSVLFDSVRIRLRLSGERCSWCPRFLLRIDGRNSWKFARPFRSFGKLFSPGLSFMHRTISGDLFNELCMLFSFPICLKHFIAPAVVLPHIRPMLSAVRSPDRIFLAQISHPQSRQNVHTSTAAAKYA